MRNLFVFLFAFTFLFRIILSFFVWHPDVRNNMDWGKRFYEYGASKFYSPESNVWSFLWPNQPPGSIYLFAFIYKIYEFLFSIFWFLNIKIRLFPSIIISLLFPPEILLVNSLYSALMHFPGIISDLLLAFLIYKSLLALDKKNVAKLAALIFLLNPVVWYNSSVWGQYDSFVFLLALSGFYFLINKKPVLASISYSLSLYTKATPLIFLPVFLVYWFKSKFSLKDRFLSLTLPILLIGFLTLPFSRGEPFSWLFNLYKDKIFIEQRQVVTSNAFNIWAGLTGIYQVSHYDFLGPFTYKTWGLIFYSISYLFPLILIFKKRDIKSLVWTLAMVSISSFSLLTNMHERYLFPFFPLFTIVTFMDKRLFGIYVLISILNFLNLYNFWWFPDIGFLKSFLSYNEGINARILGYLEFFIFVLLYRIFLKKFLKYIL